MTSTLAPTATISSTGLVVRTNVDDWDPFELMLRPPNNETHSQRARRVKEESNARMVSEAIDEDINRARQARRRRTVKLLLLGQSESGKSTLLKNFQLLYTPKQFKEERSSWRSIIYLNILRSVRLILEAVTESQDHARDQSPTHSTSPSMDSSSTMTLTSFPSPTRSSSIHSKLASQSSFSSLRPERERPSSSRRNQSPTPTPSLGSLNPPVLQTAPQTHPRQLTHEHTALFARLSALHVLELSLISRLSTKGETEATTRSSRGLHEFAVLATSKWKEVRLWGPRSPESEDGGSPTRLKGYLSEDEAYKKERAEESRVANALKEAMDDIDALWLDPVVRGLPAVKRLWLEDYPGFFLDSLSRVTARNYLPSEDDVLKARLKTLGVTEYHFSLQHRYPAYPDWRVFDVGGTRCQREYWVPYFDDMDAIIFLAPISCFDQNLLEDHATNRLQDSLELWTSLCANKLLRSCHLVLFLNKCDILEKKLNSGIQFSKYVKTYGDQKGNDYESVRQYLKRKFEALLKHYSPVNRPFYCHFTALTNRKTTNAMLESVTDMVIRQSLSSATLF